MVTTRSLVVWLLICLLMTSGILVPFASGAETSSFGGDVFYTSHNPMGTIDSVTADRAALLPGDSGDSPTVTGDTGKDGSQAEGNKGSVSPTASPLADQNGFNAPEPPETTTADTTTADTTKDTEETLVAGYSTALVNSPANRTHNIGLALNILNGYIIKPGEVFSFNRVVGPRTKKRGFKTAMVIVNRRFVPGIGGGVCQVASTLYNVVLSAGLKVVERYPHSLKVSYVPPGRDAAVSYGVQDLKFVNTLGYPVMIRTEKTDRAVKIEFHRLPQ